MSTFYRKTGEDKTIYKDPEMMQGIATEEEAQKAGVIPDWEASWKPPGETNIQTIGTAYRVPKTSFTDQSPIEKTPIYNPIEKTKEPALDDISGLMTRYGLKSYDFTPQQALQTQYQQALQPTPAETDIATQLADLRKRASLEDIGAGQEIARLESQPAEVVRGIVEAQKGQFGKEYAFRQQTLAAQEKNLMDRLGIEQQKRTGYMEGIKTSLGFGQQELDNRIKIQQVLQAEEDKLLARTDKLTDNARQTLAAILNQFQGLDLDNIDSATQGQLAQMAGQAGIPLGILQAGLKAQKDQQAFENLLAKQKLQPSAPTLKIDTIEDANGNVSIISTDPTTGKSTIENLGRIGKGTPSSSDNTPSSYREWSLAGGLKGTGETYAQFLSKDKIVKEISPYQEERMVRNLASIKEIRSKVSGWTTGFGSLLAGIPTTEARDFKAAVDMLKSNITFGELTAMREASKTGGALGQISDMENKLLSAALGSLDIGQSEEAFLSNLQKIENSINRWKAIASQENTSNQNNDPLGIR